MRWNTIMSRKSIFAYIFRAFLLLAAVAVALLFLGSILSSLTMERMAHRLNYQKLVDRQRNLLLHEQYESFRLGGSAGRDYFEVVDESGKLLYASRKEGEEKDRFTKQELRLIPDISSDSYILTQKVKTKEGQSQTLVLEYNAGGDREIDFSLLRYLILDSENNVIFASADGWQKHYSDRELKFWAEEQMDGYMLEKAQFQTDKKENRYLIFYHKPLSEKEYYRISRVSYYFFTGFVLVFVFILYFTIRWVQIQFQKPLNRLETALAKVAEEDSEPVVTDGPEELVRICDCFNQMRERLGESERRRIRLEENRQKMIADISHDLKTPLTVIEGYTKALLDGVIPEAKRSDYLQVIHKKCVTLSKLANTFYSYSELEHPEYALRLETGDICEYLRAYLAEVYEELVSVHGLELGFDIPERQILWDYDKLQLKRVFENIMSNTLKYAGEGTKVFVSLKERQTAGKRQVEILIGDNGNPIPDPIREKIFEPFVIGDLARSSGYGSGLGMAISRKIVLLHGGSITLLPKGSVEGHNVYRILLTENGISGIDVNN